MNKSRSSSAVDSNNHARLMYIRTDTGNYHPQTSIKYLILANFQVKAFTFTQKYRHCTQHITLTNLLINYLLLESIQQPPTKIYFFQTRFPSSVQVMQQTVIPPIQFHLCINNDDTYSSPLHKCSRWRHVRMTKARSKMNVRRWQICCL